jgi:hypothetical protein
MHLKTLILLDWDDTLYPTSWTVKNNIDMNDKNNIRKYQLYFFKLDAILYKLISTLLKYGTVIIVTNAAKKWVFMTLTMLPNTQKLIQDKVYIFSARELYQNQYPNEMTLWKKLIFKKIVSQYFLENCTQNIISVGDADHEFIALTDLYDINSVTNKKLLKTIRFLTTPSFESLIDQLQVLSKCSQQICTNAKHMDLKFEDNLYNNN